MPYRVDDDVVDPIAALCARPQPVLARALAYPRGHRTGRHRHARAQLVYASSGVMTVSTAAGLWVVPPQRAVWVPAGVVHDVHAVRDLAMRSLYVAPAAAPGLPERCCVVAVPPLLRELVVHATTLAPDYPPDGPEARVMAVILDRIRTLPAAPLHLPVPHDPVLTRVCEALLADASDPRTLDAWARTLATSTRTLARRFRAHTGMGFREWRQQARLLRALERLAGGEPVTRVALDLGYESPSAFGAMFRRALGQTPREYFRGPAP